MTRKPQRFPLHKPIVEEAVILCMGPGGPVESVKHKAAGRDLEADVVLGRLALHGQCAIAQGLPITYKRQVWKLEANGRTYAVYEGRVGDLPVFVPMIDFLHDEVAA